jgi:DUF2946 family protein
MTSRSSFLRWALWLAAFALLLKAAVPMLATASAHVQGKTLVEVCTVYGMATVAVDDQGAPLPPPEHGTAHNGEHCVLSGLMALSTPAPVAAHLPVVEPALALRVGATYFQTPDANAVWISGLKHGPPALS